MTTVSQRQKDSIVSHITYLLSKDGEKVTIDQRILTLTKDEKRVSVYFEHRWKEGLQCPETGPCHPKGGEEGHRPPNTNPTLVSGPFIRSKRRREGHRRIVVDKRTLCLFPVGQSRMTKVEKNTRRSLPGPFLYNTHSCLRVKQTQKVHEI